MNLQGENNTGRMDSLGAASEILSNLRIAKMRIAFSDFHDRWMQDQLQSSCKFYVVLDGALCISKRDRSVTYTLCNHQFAFVFGDDFVVSSRELDAYEPCRGVRAVFELSFGDMVISPGVLPSILASRSNDASVSKHVELLASELGKPGHHARPMIASMVTTLLLKALGNAHEQGDCSAMILQVAGDEHLGPAVALMHESPGDAWSLERLANESGLSRSSFAKRFQSTLGRSAFAYLRELRLSRAAALLTTTGMTVHEVATEVGYSSESAFSSAFQEFHGEAPGRFRVANRVSGGSAAG